MLPNIFCDKNDKNDNTNDNKNQSQSINEIKYKNTSDNTSKIKIGYVSDLHMDLMKTRKDKEALEKRLVRAAHKFQILVFAGNIDKGTSSYRLLSDLSEFCFVILVLGNHEYYGSSVPRVHREWSNIMSATSPKTTTKFHVLNNSTVDILGIRFIGSTLWFNAENININDFNDFNNNNDFKQIQHLSPKQVSQMSATSLKFIQTELNNVTKYKDKQKCVVISHHMPNMSNMTSADLCDVNFSYLTKYLTVQICVLGFTDILT